MFRTRQSWKCLCALLTMAVVGPGHSAPLRAAESPAMPQTNAAAKERILDSSAWQAAMLGFNEWLSVQVRYDTEEVMQLKSQLNEKIQNMSAGQLQAFLIELQEKLSIVVSEEGMEARAWAQEYLTLLSRTKAEEFRKRLPDLAGMTPAQMRQALLDVQKERIGIQSRQKAFERTRDQQVAAYREMHRQTADANARSRSTMSSGASFGGQYAPKNNVRRTYTPPPPLLFGFGYRW